MPKLKPKGIWNRIRGSLKQLEWKERTQSWMKGVKGYIIDTFLFIRLLNPILSLNFLKRCIFRQKFEVWWFHQSSNLTSVVTKWWHDVTEIFGIFHLMKSGSWSLHSYVSIVLFHKALQVSSIACEYSIWGCDCSIIRKIDQMSRGPIGPWQAHADRQKSALEVHQRKKCLPISWGTTRFWNT
jgi:hypothetical protein